jgi:hypothetical protein
MRRYRLKNGTAKPVTKPVTKPASGAADAAVAQIKQELATAKARIAELEARGASIASMGNSEIAALQQQRDTALGEAANLRKMLDDGHRVVVQAKAILGAKAIFPAEMRRTMRYATHEDRAPDPKWKVRFKSLFQFIEEHDRMLFKKPLPPQGRDVPSTAEEWEARKWHAKEEARTKRAAKRAAKKNPPKSLGRR